ncbi:MAG: hypothetical protein ACI4UA_04885, partial [Bacteroidaceae bacterium]
MDKKVLVSILAMTSASTMTAWADANVDKLKNDSLQNWGVNSEDTKLTLVDGVITSPDGTPISQKIDLAPGTYRFNYIATSTFNVTTKVDGKDVSENLEFTVEGNAVKTVEIVMSATEEGKEFRVGNPTLTLVYDFNAARKVLEGQLTDAINKIVEGDEEATELSEEASEIASRLKLLVDDTEGAYQAYVDNEMWKGTDGCKFAAEIKAVDEKAGAQGANMSAYQAASDAIKAQQEALDAVNATLARYETATNGTFEYTQGITEGKPEAAQKIIDDYQAKANEAHENGNAAEVLTETANETFATEASKAISDFD